MVMEARSPIHNNRNLRDLQRAALIEMLHFNMDNQFQNVSGRTEAPNTLLETSPWKVLILDSVGQRILSPILKVNELRDHGVTLYLQLHSERQPINDVPAVYFVEPNAENIIRICKDLQSNLYESFYLNFTSSIPRPLLEDLAYNTAQSGSSPLISKIYDQYLNYVSLERNLFTLAMPDTFISLNDTSSSETLIESTLDGIGASLFSALLTMGGQPPLIYCSKGTAAESLGERLDTKIRNYLVNSKSAYLGDPNGLGIDETLQRPLLLLLDRTFDIVTLLRHSSTYNALVHDALGMKLNLVSVSSSETGPESKLFYIDSKDNFWSKNMSLPFPNVAENVDLALKEYNTDMQQVKSGGIANIQSVDELGAISSTMSAKELQIAINVLPELTERKRIIDSHLQMSTALLEQIKNRSLGEFFHLEQAIIEQPKNKIIEMIRGKQGNPTDKMRLFLVYYFAQEEITKEDLSMFEVCLKEAGCDITALDFCKKIKSFQRMSAKTSQTVNTHGKGTTGDFLHSFGSKFGGGVLGNMLSSVKNLLPESDDTPLTKLVDSAIQHATGASSGTAAAFRTLTGNVSTPKEDQFTIFDPKQTRSTVPADRSKQTPMTPQKSAFNQLILFIIGGSNYTEYNHVQEFLLKKQQLNMSLTFGTTDLLTGEEFLNQLAKLYRS